jgi:hypothetical protein
MYRTFYRVFLVLVVLGAIAGLGAFAYQAGVTHGIAQGVLFQGSELPAPVYPYYGSWYGKPFFGFGLFSCLVPLFLLFLVFFALRGLFWHRRGGWGRMHSGPWGWPPSGDRRNWKEHVPPVVEEWHRKMHAGPSSPESAGSE